MSTFNNEASKVNKLYGPGITEDDLFVPNKVRARLIFLAIMSVIISSS